MIGAPAVRVAARTTYGVCQLGTRGWIARLVAGCVIAATALVSIATPASAASSRTEMYGVSGAYLGYGYWASRPYGLNDNGYLYVEDGYCDGSNGIIAGLYVYRSGRWVLVNVVSVRGCGSTNYIDVKRHLDGGPRQNEEILFKVCKLLPDGTWKDCKDKTSYNTDF